MLFNTLFFQLKQQLLLEKSEFLCVFIDLLLLMSHLQNRPSTDAIHLHAIDKDETFGQIITEYWIEPQMGLSRVRGSYPSSSYLEGKDFKGIGDVVSHFITFFARMFSFFGYEELSFVFIVVIPLVLFHDQRALLQVFYLLFFKRPVK